jgi:hypothetical protein
VSPPAHPEIEQDIGIRDALPTNGTQIDAASSIPPTRHPATATFGIQISR